jgi:hypothetical protein
VLLLPKPLAQCRELIAFSLKKATILREPLLRELPDVLEALLLLSNGGRVVVALLANERELFACFSKLASQLHRTRLAVAHGVLIALSLPSQLLHTSKQSCILLTKRDFITANSQELFAVRSRLVREELQPTAVLLGFAANGCQLSFESRTRSLPLLAVAFTLPKLHAEVVGILRAGCELEQQAAQSNSPSFCLAPAAAAAARRRVVVLQRAPCSG